MSLDTNQDRLHWKVLHEGNFSDEFDFLESLLIADGVPQENIPKLLNPTADLTYDPFLMVNMDKAIEMVHEVVKKNSKIFVLPDNDCDGMTSSAVMIQFLKVINPNINIEYKLTYDKSHGLKFENLMGYTKDEFDLFIIPDASMECSDARQITKNFSAKILVLDHHLVSTEYLDTKTGKWITKVEADKIRDKRSNQIEEDVYTNYCVAVNCHDGQYPNPDLSGVGVVQKFVEAYLERYAEEDKLDLGLREQFLDLVSLGLCGDSMDSRSLECRYYMIEGLKPKHLKNSFIKELIARNEDDFKFGATLHTNGWVLAPKINGVIRYGKPEEIEEVYEALLGSTEMVEYQPRRKSKNDPKPPVETHTIQWDAARICENVKSRQDTAVRKGMRELKETIDKEGLDKNSVIFVDGTKILEKRTISGLVANRLASEYMRPVVLLRERDSTTYGGSGRGYDKGNIEDFNAFLSKAGGSCFGHSNAFGLQIPKNSLEQIIKNCNRMMPLKDLCTVHTVDWEIPATKMKVEYVTEVANNYAVFGNKVPEPLFAITNLRINASHILSYGTHAGFIRFNYKGITFVKKYCPIGDYDKMTMRDRNTFGINKKPLVLNLICQFVLNSWEDKVNPEVKILYYDVAEDTSRDADFDIMVKSKNAEVKKKPEDIDIPEIRILDGGSSTLVNTEKTKKVEAKDESEITITLDGNDIASGKEKKLTIADDFIF